MLGGLLHDQLAHIHTAGEEDIVKALVQQGGVLFPPPLDHRHPLRGEHRLDQLRQGLAGVGGVGAGFQHHAVPRRHRPKEGVQAQEVGVIPGGHDEGHPVGLRQLIALGHILGQGGGPPLGTGPLGGHFHKIPQLVQAQPQFAQIALKVGLVQVRLQGIQHLFLPGLELRF